MEFITVAICGVLLILAITAYFVIANPGGASTASSSKPTSEVGLNEREYQKFKLIERTQISSNTVLFRFALHHPSQRVGLPVGKHMSLKCTDAEGKLVLRSYTPVSSDDDLGYFDLLVKLYPTGKMSQYLQALQIGQTIEARGPNGSLEYKGRGDFVIKRAGGRVQSVNAKNVGMIAGGSGITPMLQIIRDVSKHSPHDATNLSLIFANVTEADILLRAELDAIRENRSLTKVTYTLDRPGEAWTGETGFVTPEMITKHLPKPSPDTLILLCGPGPMVNGMEKHLQGLGYTEDMYFKF